METQLPRRFQRAPRLTCLWGYPRREDFEGSIILMKTTACSSPNTSQHWLWFPWMNIGFFSDSDICIYTFFTIVYQSISCIAISHAISRCWYFSLLVGSTSAQASATCLAASKDSSTAFFIRRSNSLTFSMPTPQLLCKMDRHVDVVCLNCLIYLFFYKHFNTV